MQPSPRTPSESPSPSRQTGRIHRHEERADPAAADSRLGRGKDDDDVRRFRVRDPDLPAGEHVAALVEARDGLLVRGIRAGVLLRQRERAERFSRRQRGEPQLFLRVAAELRERLGDQRVVDRGDDRDHRAGLRQRLDRERVADISRPAPPQSGASVTPIRPSAAASRTRSRGNAFVSSIAAAARRDSRGGELRDAPLEGLLIVRELEVHASNDTSACPPSLQLRWVRRPASAEATAVRRSLGGGGKAEAAEFSGLKAEATPTNAPAARRSAAACRRSPAAPPAARVSDRRRS